MPITSIFFAINTYLDWYGTQGRTIIHAHHNQRQKLLHCKGEEPPFTKIWKEEDREKLLLRDCTYR